MTETAFNLFLPFDRDDRCEHALYVSHSVDNDNGLSADGVTATARTGPSQVPLRVKARRCWGADKLN